MFEHRFPPYWSTLKKLIWIVGTGIAGASAVWKTVTGALIHITDALASPMQKCEVSLEPVQDLHGQDAPYPAGGGKNLLSLPDETFVQFAEYEIDPIPAGTYIYSGIVTSTDTDGNKCAIIFLDESKNTHVSKLLDRSTGTTRIASSEFTVSSAIKYVRLYASNGYPSGEGDTANFKDNMVCPATASNPTSYAPYSNICPITGWTGCEVTRTGGNLLPLDIYTGITYNKSTGTVFNPVKSDRSWLANNDRIEYTVSSTYTTLSVMTKLLPPGKYNIKLKKESSGSLRCTAYRLDKDFKVTYQSNNSNVSNYSTLWTLTEYGYIAFFLDSSTVSSGTYSLSALQVTVEEQTEVVQPYFGTTYPISWQTEAGTVYGGTLDLVSGELKPYKEYDSYNGETLTGRWLSSMDKYVAGTTPTIGAQVVDLDGYDTTVQLTPQEISTLKGENNIWADVNGEITLTYKSNGNDSDIVGIGKADFMKLLS